MSSECLYPLSLALAACLAVVPLCTYFFREYRTGIGRITPIDLEFFEEGVPFWRQSVSLPVQDGCRVCNDIRCGRRFIDLRSSVNLFMSVFTASNLAAIAAQSFVPVTSRG
jgi:hypothetical protein